MLRLCEILQEELEEILSFSPKGLFINDVTQEGEGVNLLHKHFRSFDQILYAPLKEHHFENLILHFHFNLSNILINRNYKHVFNLDRQYNLYTFIIPLSKTEVIQTISIVILNGVISLTNKTFVTLCIKAWVKQAI